MLRIIRNSCGIVLLLLFAQCKTAQGPKGLTVEATCTEFLYNLNNHEYEKAKLLATEATVKKIEFIESLNKMAGGGKVIVKDIKTQLTGCTTDKKEAFCTYKTFSGGEQKVFLLKQKGRWLVDLKKDE
jgi:hypothetical protein